MRLALLLWSASPFFLVSGVWAQLVWAFFGAPLPLTVLVALNLNRQQLNGFLKWAYCQSVSAKIRFHFL